jgi:hypothetical protein
MKRIGLAVLLATISLPLNAVEIKTAPVVQLSGLIRDAIPALNPSQIAVPTLSPNAGTLPLVVPAAFDTTKAQVLLDRVPTASGRQLETAKPEPLPAASPQQVMTAVNAVLKDFSADDIAKMSDADVSAVSQLVIDQLQGRKSPTNMKAVVALANAKANALMARRGKTEETLMNPGHNDMHPDEILVQGTPDQARLLRPTTEPERRADFGGFRKAPQIEKDTVFRHYTTAQGYTEIMKSKSLWNGFVPYVQLSRGTFKKTFRDVSGLFFTLPKVAGDDVGVPARDFDHYVDVVLPKHLPLMELEPGAIYLVPLPGATRDWVLDMYLKWTRGELTTTTYNSMIATMDKEGGPGPSVQVPVKIVGHGRVR